MCWASSSKTGKALFQKFDLKGRRLASRYDVEVRIAAKTSHDFKMAFGGGELYFEH